MPPGKVAPIDTIPDLIMPGDYLIFSDLGTVQNIPGVLNVVIAFNQGPEINISSFGDPFKRMTVGVATTEITIRFLHHSGAIANIILVASAATAISALPSSRMYMVRSLDLTVPNPSEPDDLHRFSISTDPIQGVRVKKENIKEEKLDLFHEEEDNDPMPRQLNKITGKQAAMLRARAAEAGYKTDRAFLEWLEYNSGFDMPLDMVEDMLSADLDGVLTRLANPRR